MSACGSKRKRMNSFYQNAELELGATEEDKLALEVFTNSVKKHKSGKKECLEMISSSSDIKPMYRKIAIVDVQGSIKIEKTRIRSTVELRFKNEGFVMQIVQGGENSKGISAQNQRTLQSWKYGMASSSSRHNSLNVRSFNFNGELVAKEVIIENGEVVDSISPDDDEQKITELFETEPEYAFEYEHKFLVSSVIILSDVQLTISPNAVSKPKFEGSFSANSRVMLSKLATKKMHLKVHRQSQVLLNKCVVDSLRIKSTNVCQVHANACELQSVIINAEGVERYKFDDKCEIQHFGLELSGIASIEAKCRVDTSKIRATGMGKLNGLFVRNKLEISYNEMCTFSIGTAKKCKVYKTNVTTTSKIL